jgi:hypothetical protein
MHDIAAYLPYGCALPISQVEWMVSMSLAPLIAKLAFEPDVAVPYLALAGVS